MSNTARPDFSAAPQAVLLAEGVVASATASLIDLGGIDANQVLAYDLAHAAAAVATARGILEYGALGELEARTAGAFVAEVLVDLATARSGASATGASGATGWRPPPSSSPPTVTRPSWPTWR